jgi:glycosyltransferase involved in cell wall biosynthesis
MRRLAIVGIQGLPNNYGGFETLSDYLVKFLASSIDITVYCSNEVEKQANCSYHKAKLKYINISSHGAKGIFYDSLALLNASWDNYDVILILGFGAGFMIPLLPQKTRKKIILNFGGLDWKRNKWNKLAQCVIKFCERQLVINAHSLIADNKYIQEYIIETYKKSSKLIAYGGDQVSYQPITDDMKSKYPFLNEKYAFEVARIQPDNNIDMIIDAFLKVNSMPLVIVGNWNSSKYGINTKAKYKGKSNIILLDAIYDQKNLNVLRSNCYIYVHGHSAGGTNPSLCEAMFLGLPVFAFSNGYNQATTYNRAMYFRNKDELEHLISNVDPLKLELMRKELKEIAQQHYRWKFVAEEYLKEFEKI